MGMTYSKKVYQETARRWLHELGFSRVHHQKGVYFDGHDRSDVVADRLKFLAIMEEFDNKSISFNGNIPELNGEKPLVWYTMKALFTQIATRHSFWGTKNTYVLHQKSLGAAIMVSDFVDEVCGFVRSQTEELLELSNGGYFNSDHLLEQVEHTISIFEKIHPSNQALSLFDNAHSHKKRLMIH